MILYNDTGNAPEKSNISANIREKSKSLLGLSTGARRSCLKKKTRGEKSGGTVPLSKLAPDAKNFSGALIDWISLSWWTRYNTYHRNWCPTMITYRILAGDGYHFWPTIVFTWLYSNLDFPVERHSILYVLHIQ